MKKIVFSGYYGFGNAGDEAMLAAIIQVTKQRHTDCAITVISGNPRDTAVRHQVAAVYIFDMLAIIKVLCGADLLISGGGSLLQNVTSSRSIYYYIAVLALGRMLAKKVMLYGQGIGPVKGRFAKALMRYVVNKADYITVRDEGSFYELREIGVWRPPVEITADAVLGMERCETATGRKLLLKTGLTMQRPIVAIAPRRWGSGNYFKAFAEAADTLIETRNVDILFLPLHVPSDNKVCDEFMQLMRNKAYIFDGNCDASGFMSILGNCELLIGVRLHALIFAAIMQIPVVGISYDPKIDRFMRSLGLNCHARLRELDGARLATEVTAQLENIKFSQERMARAMSGLRAKALRNAEIASELINT